MFFIYASFLEFILVNYLARWVQDPEQKKQKKDNAMLMLQNTATPVRFDNNNCYKLDNGYTTDADDLE